MKNLLCSIIAQLILHSSLFHSSFALFFLSEIFKELCTFKRIDAFNIFDIQFAFELSYIFESFAFHPCREEAVGFSNKCVCIQIDCATNFYG